MQIFQKISFHIGFYIIHNETIYICWINLTFLFIIIFFNAILIFLLFYSTWVKRREEVFWWNQLLMTDVN